MQNNKKENMIRLKEMLEKDSELKHIYVKRWGMDESIIDIPVNNAIQTINLNPFWEIIVSIPQLDGDLQQLFKDDDIAAPALEEVVKKDELEAPAAPTDNEIKKAMKTLEKTPSDPIVPIYKDIPVATSKELPAGIATKPNVVKNVLKCDKCKFIAKSRAGLTLHNKKHK